MEKRDDIKKYYDRSTRFTKALNLLLIINVCLSIANALQILGSCHWLLTVLIIGDVMYCLLGVVNEYCIFYKAEEMRRINAIEDGFGVDLIDKKTKMFYTNGYENSFARYTINIFESCFFTKNIAEKMCIGYGAKSILGVVIFLIAILSSSNNQISLAIAEVVFSATVIEQSARFFLYCYRVNRVYELMYMNLITNHEIKSNSCVGLLSEIVEYESIKAYFRIQLSERIYNKNKEKLEKDFEEIKARIYSFDELS